MLYENHIACTYACLWQGRGEICGWFMVSTSYSLVKREGTRVNLFMGKSRRLLCIHVQRVVYQVWQHFAECGIALPMYKKIIRMWDSYRCVHICLCMLSIHGPRIQEIICYHELCALDKDLCIVETVIPGEGFGMTLILMLGCHNFC